MAETNPRWLVWLGLIGSDGPCLWLVQGARKHVADARKLAQKLAREYRADGTSGRIVSITNCPNYRPGFGANREPDRLDEMISEKGVRCRIGDIWPD